ncbi:MAG: succinylglutamate desuccinylase [marine bacterium B5-7]|nr:MAG: succinylglutamate desuccinylase [marine bacterium B5-7]
MSSNDRKADVIKSRYAFVKILTGSDLSIRRLPLMSVTSEKSGPVVWITACVHGDEVVGMAVIHEVFKKIRRTLLCGSVYAFPLMNPIGLETISRKITMSREDLNRSFPGKAEGTLGERLANRIFNTILGTSPDLVLDLHSDWKQSIPYVILDRRSQKMDKQTYDTTREYARQTGFVSLLEDEILTDSLSYNLLENNIPALTLELGEPYVINEENVRLGLGAIWNILSSMGMIEPLQERFIFPTSKVYKGKLFKYNDQPYSSKSGIIRFLAKPGDEIKQGDAFARIVNAFGKHQETVRAIHDGIVLGHSDSSVVFPGMPIMAFGVI